MEKAILVKAKLNLIVERLNLIEAKSIYISKKFYLVEEKTIFTEAESNLAPMAIVRSRP